MPIDLQPVVPPSRQRDLSLSFSREWDWLSNQQYDPNRAWQGTTGVRRGTTTGGPTFGQFLDTGDYQRYAILPKATPLTSPILQGERLGPHTRLGTVELDMIDPFSTIESIPDALGLNTQDGGPMSWLANNGPTMFLAQKQIDLFGMGDTGAPARLADYALALPNLAIRKLLGQNTTTGQPIATTPDLPYRFQHDPGYWGLVTQLDDDALRQMARSVAARYIDPSRNSELVSQLFDQFKIDQRKAQALSSGNDAIDYRAMKRAYAEAAGTPPALAGSGWQGLPFVGTWLSELANPVSKQETAYWNGLDVAERQRHLADAGLIQMGSDILASLPALSGLGTVLAFARGTPTGVAIASDALGYGYRAYDLSLRTINAIMATGLTVAATNWALEAAVPGYSEFLGESIDRARPVSQSALMTAVNAAGFWSTGTWGGATAVTAAVRGADAVLSKMGLAHPLGVSELAFFRFGMGGRAVRDTLAGVGLNPKGLDLAAKRTFMSYLTNHIEREARAPFEAAMRGAKTGLRELDDLLDLGAKQARAQEMLGAYLEHLPSITEGYTRILALARKPRSINPGIEVREVEDWVRRAGRTLDHELAGRYSHDYGPGFIADLVGEYSPRAMEAWARAKVTQLGGNGAKLGRHTTDEWAQIIRTLHNYQFDAWNGEVHAALNMPGPDGQPAGEAGRLAVIRADHLFGDLADNVLQVIRGDDAALAKELVGKVIRDTPEGRDWFANTWKPRPGVDKVPENAPITVFANWLEDVRPALPNRRPLPDPASPTAMAPLNAIHRKMSEEGIWTLAFKPVDEAGQFVSYARTRTGNVFRSPFVEYLLDNPAMVELGNRGWLASKFDATFRGFRTWRLTEFQRGSLYRSLTSRFDFTSEQIERFHAGVLQLSREAHAQPQTLGTWPKPVPLGEKIAGDLDRLAQSVFGKGPYPLREGGVAAIDWQHEVAGAYQQSLRLNLTAGVTSHLKYRIPGAGFAADVIYPVWRYFLSPIFKGGDLGESPLINAGRGINPRGDTLREALYRHGGLGNDYGLVSEEMTLDTMIQATTGHMPTTAEQRHAASVGFYASRLPEDLSLAAQGAATRGAAQEFRQAHVGGSPIIPERPRAPGAQASKLADLPADFTLDPRDVAPDYVGIPEDLPAEERGMWHATTNVDGVLHDGLLSRSELRQRAVDPVAQRRIDELASQVDVAREEMRRQMDAHGNRLSAPPPELAAARQRYSSLVDELDAAEAAARQATPEGLGGGFIDVGRNVSVTVLEVHAREIAERLALAAKAAKGQTTIEEIVDHFTAYGRYPDEDPVFMSTVLRRLGYIDHAYSEWDPFIAELHTRYDQGVRGDLHYTLVQQLDNGLKDLAVEGEGFAGTVGLTAPWENMARIDPDKIGIVQVAARRGQAPARIGPDEFELQFANRDVWVIDDRPDLPPIASGDRESLLRQLRSTMAEEPSALQRRANALNAELNDLVGPNGIEPGLEGRAQAIIDELDKVERQILSDGGPVWRWENAPPHLRDRFAEANPDMAQAADPVQREEAFSAWQRQPGSAESLAEVAGTPEAMFETINRVARQEATALPKQSWKARAWETFWHPTGFKQRQAHLLQMKLMADEFPALLRASGNEEVVQVFRSLGIPEKRWADFLLEDRRLLDNWLNSRDEKDLQALLDHAGADTRGQLDALYRSEDWATITSLWGLNLRSTQEESFGAHFYVPYRSAFERSINHPVLGIYPASWALKAAREWARFLYRNQTFGELRLGMSPAVALAELSRAQSSAFAQSNPDDLTTYLDKGPMGSIFFIFNLIMPGDWSSLPFPASRTIREVWRGNYDPFAIMQRNVEFIGASRDARLFGESVGEMRDLLFGPAPDKEKALRLWSVQGVEGAFGQPRR